MRNRFKKVMSRIRAMNRLARYSLALLLIALVLVVSYPWYSSFFISGCSRSVNAAAVADLKNAYTAAQFYFEDHPEGVVNLDLLKKEGFWQSQGVETIILNGTRNGLFIQASHKDGRWVFTVDARRQIKKEEK